MILQKFKLFIIMFIPVAMTSCVTISQNNNSLFQYLKNAEVQYENSFQKSHIKEALSDMINMPASELKKKKYADYSGKPEQWPLPVLISKYFVPDNSSKKLGENFYAEIKSQKVQKKIHFILAELQ